MIAPLQAQTKAVLPPSFRPVQTGLLQRQCACGQHAGSGECEECRKKREGTIQRAAVSATPVYNVPPIVHEALNSPGQPLDAGTRAFMEPRFGHDFSGLRVHTDGRAAESARAVNAVAYTVGRDIVFGAGQYAPMATEGRRLIAHELTHTIQQGSAVQGMQGKLEITKPGDTVEREADSISEAVLQGTPFIVTNGVATQMARQPALWSGGGVPLPEQFSDHMHYQQIECVRRELDDPALWSGGVPSPEDWDRANETCKSETHYTGEDVTYEELQRPKPATILEQSIDETQFFLDWYYEHTKAPVPSRVADAFGHCWLACMYTKKYGSIATAIGGKAIELLKEIFFIQHDSYRQDTNNETLGRSFGSKGLDCYDACRNASIAPSGGLDLSAPKCSLYDPNHVPKWYTDK